MKQTSLYLLLAMCVWCLLMLGFRMTYWNSTSYSFLPSNLFLAAVPLLLSHLAARRVANPQRWALAVLWLLFFPNAPYLLTDLIHLAHKRGVPIFYDVTMLISFAGAGAVCGFLSLQQIQNLIATRGYPRLSWLFAIGCLFLASFGIYLGRFVRLNSWDVLIRPLRFVTAAATPVLDPASHLSTWAMTLSLGVLLSLTYGFFAISHPDSRMRVEVSMP